MLINKLEKQMKRWLGTFIIYFTTTMGLGIGDKIKKFSGFEFDKRSTAYQDKTEFLTTLDKDTLNAFGKI